jgi:hypothetical protein
MHTIFLVLMYICTYVHIECRPDIKYKGTGYGGKMKGGWMKKIHHFRTKNSRM